MVRFVRTEIPTYTQPYQQPQRGMVDTGMGQINVFDPTNLPAQRRVVDAGLEKFNVLNTANLPATQQTTAEQRGVRFVPVQQDRRLIPMEARQAAQELRPWQMGQIVPQANIAERAALGVMQPLTINDEEFAGMLKQADPSIVVESDRENDVWNVYSPQTQKAFVINKKGFSLNDASNIAATMAASLPAGRAATMFGRSALEAGIQTGIEGGQKGLGGKFNIEEPMLAGGFSIGTDLVSLARQARQSARGAASVMEEAGQRGVSPQQAQTASQIGQVVTSQQAPVQQAANLAGIINPDPNVISAGRRLGLNEVLPPRVYSRNPQYVQVEQAIAGIPGNQMAAAEKEAMLATAAKADQFITEFGGTRDISQLNEGIVNNINSTLDELRVQSDVLYDNLSSSVNKRQRVDSTDIRRYLVMKARDLGGVDNLNSLEKQVLRQVSSSRRPTYGYVDNLRQSVGEKYGQALKGNQFGDTTTYELKNLYNLLTDAQGTAIEEIAGKEMKTSWDAAKGLVQQRKALEESAVNLMGKEFSRPIIPQVRAGISSLVEKGDVYGFNKVLKGIPEQYRQAAVVSAVDSLFTKGARTQNQLHMAGFASQWEKLSRQPTAKAQLTKYLPENAPQFLNDLALISKQYANAIAGPRTGVVNAMEKFGSDQGFISKILPIIPYGKKIDEIISLPQPDVLKSASDLMANPDFKRVIIASAQGKPTQQLEQAVVKSQVFQNWLGKLPPNYGSRILSVGLADYFTGETE